MHTHELCNQRAAMLQSLLFMMLPGLKLVGGFHWFSARFSSWQERASMIPSPVAQHCNSYVAMLLTPLLSHELRYSGGPFAKVTIYRSFNLCISPLSGPFKLNIFRVLFHAVPYCTVGQPSKEQTRNCHVMI